MMTSYDKLCLILALSSMSQKELQAALNEMQYRNTVIIDDIKKFRESDKIKNYNFFIESKIKHKNTFENSSPELRSHITNISKEIKNVTGLNYGQIAQKIAILLHEASPEIEIPVFGKQSFREWLAELFQVFQSDSQLLHIIMRFIEEQKTSNEKSHWSF